MSLLIKFNILLPVVVTASFAGSALQISVIIDCDQTDLSPLTVVMVSLPVFVVGRFHEAWMLHDRR